MYKILVCDDEEKIRLLIKKYAEFEGHTVIEAENGMEAVKLFKEQVCDIVIMDVMMPELDGLSACRQIRKLSDVPILILSARGEEYDKISGFEFGVDDYVVKPFSPKELMLRIEAIMKRYKKPPLIEQEPETVKKDIVNVGGITVDYTGRYVYVDGERIDMSPKEYELFFYLVRNRNIALLHLHSHAQIHRTAQQRKQRAVVAYCTAFSRRKAVFTQIVYYAVLADTHKAANLK